MRINRSSSRFETVGELRRAAESRLKTAIADDLWTLLRETAADLGLAAAAPYGDVDLDLAVQWLLPRWAAHVPFLKRAQAEVSERLQAEDIRARIEALRMSLFARSTAPFPSLHAADKWLRKTAKEHGGTRVVAYAERAGEVMGSKRSRVEAQSLRGTSARGVSALLSEGLVIAYLRPNESVGRQAVGRQAACLGGTLDQLQKGSASLAQDVGCREADMVAHVLTAHPIFVPPVRVRLSERLGSPPSMRVISLSVHFPWVPAWIVAQVYAAAVRHPQLAPLEWRKELVRIADTPGWTTAEKLAEWNRRFPERRYKNENTFKSAASQARSVLERASTPPRTQAPARSPRKRRC